MAKKILLTTGYQPVNNQLLTDFKNQLLQHKKAYYLLPNGLLIEQAQRQIFDSGRDIVFAGQICSIDNLVRIILKLGDVHNQVIDKAMSTVIMARILENLNNEQKLHYLCSFDHLEDMAPLLLSIVREIKHHADSHEILDQEYRALTGREKDIVLIYQHYYRELQNLNVLDQDEAVTAALKLLRDKSVAFNGSMVIAAGLTWHKRQLELLTELGQRFKDIVLVIQVNEIKEGFSKRRHLIESLQEAGFRVEWAAEHPDNSLGLFAAAPPGAKPRVTVCGFNSKRLEARETVRSLKELMLKKGVSATEIAIVAYRPADYTDLLAYFSNKAGVPLQSCTTKNLLQTMPVKNILRLLSIVIKNWSADEFLQLLTTDYVWPGPVQAALIADFVRLTPERGSLSSWVSACRRQKQYAAYRNKHNFRDEQQEHILSHAQLGEVEKGLLHLQSIWEGLPAKGDFNLWYDYLLRLIADLGVEQSISKRIRQLEGELAEQLHRTWALVTQALSTHKRFRKLWPVQLDLQTFYIIIKDVFKSYLVPEQVARRRSIGVYSPRQIAGISFKHLYVLGFNEGVWPNTRYGSWLHNSDDQETTLPLPDRQNHRAGEMLQLLRTTASATEEICFSYVLKDEQDSELLPSPYLSDIEDASPDFRTVNSPDYLNWTAERAYCQQELLIESIFHRRYDSIPVDVQRRIWIEEQRFNNSNSVYNGSLAEQGILSQLMTMFSSNRSFSTTMLEQYGKCPWSFFMQRVLNIRPLEPLSVGLTPLIRGNIIHRVLARFLEQRRRHTLSFTKLKDYDRQLKDLLTAELQNVQSQLTRAGQSWAEVESDRIFYVLRLWLRNELELQSKVALRPADFEYSFAEDKVLLINCDSKTMKVEGFIDRIDVDQQHLVVYDYKSGFTPRLKDIKDGVAFQIPFYILAASSKYPEKKVLGGGYYKLAGDFNRNSGMWHADYLALNGLSKRIGDKVSEADWDSLFDQVKEYALQYRQQMQTGQFQLEPKRPCPRYCPYQAICRMTPLLLSLLEAKNNEVHS